MRAATLVLGAVVAAARSAAFGGTGAAHRVCQEAPPEILLDLRRRPRRRQDAKILDILDQHGIKAVFFVLGIHLQGTSATAEKSRELVREELRRGHAVGNHTIHHYFLCGHYYIKQAWQEIEGNAKLIEDAIGQRPDLFRTPYGAHCKQLNEPCSAGSASSRSAGTSTRRTGASRTRPRSRPPSSAS